MEKIVTVNKAKQFYLILKEKILSGEFATGEKLPSIRDLAKAYEISKTTVNIVIAMLVNDGLLKVRDGMGTYVTREQPEIKPIGVLLFDFTTSMRVETEILGHIQKNLNTSYYLNLVDTSNNYSVFIEGLQRQIKSGAAGLIINPPKDKLNVDEFKQIKSLIDGKLPVAFIVREIEGIGADFYSMDLSKGIMKAFEYFNAKNRSRTAIILHDSAKFIKEEMHGLARAVSEYSLTTEPQWIIDWSDDVEVIKSKLSAVMQQIDSIIAPDYLLYQIQSILHGSGKKIPDDLSIVAINDTAYTKMFYPQLTSIAFPVERIGRNAITTLINRVEKRLDTPFIHRNFAPELVVRGS